MEYEIINEEDIVNRVSLYSKHYFNCIYQYNNKFAVIEFNQKFSGSIILKTDYFETLDECIENYDYINDKIFSKIIIRNKNNYILRELELNDFYKNYNDLLGQLTIINKNLSLDTFKKSYDLIKNNSLHKIFVIEHFNKIIASGTIIIEPKIFRNCGYAAHIEDIIVEKKYRGKGLSKIIIDKLIEISKEYNCYRITLNCNDKNIDFYSKFGFKLSNNCMRL